MGSRRQPRRKRERTPKRRPRFRLSLERVELAAGWDGPLRGGPEPRLLAAAFQVHGGVATLLGRALHPFGTVARFPHHEAAYHELLDVGLAAAPAGTLGVLCLLVEEDDGADIATLYADLHTPARLAGFDGAAAVPEPMPMAQIMALPASRPPVSDEVCILRDGRPLEDQLRKDDWVGASVIRFDLATEGDTRWSVRAHSRDRRNDWTMWLHARVDL